MGKGGIVEPILAADLLVYVRDAHVGAGALDGDIDAAAGGLVRVEAQAGVELLEHARHGSLLEGGDELQLAAGGIHLPAGGGRRDRKEQAAEPKQGEDFRHGVLQVPGSIRISTVSRLTKWCRSAAPMCATSTSASSTKSPPCTSAKRSAVGSSGATIAGSGTSQKIRNGTLEAELMIQPVTGRAIISA